MAAPLTFASLSSCIEGTESALYAASMVSFDTNITIFFAAVLQAATM